MNDKLTEQDLQYIAEKLQVEVAALKAVQQVETGGRGGFLAPGKPVILFEGHIFWRRLKEKGMNPESYACGNEDILYPKWEKRYYKGGIREYDRLEKARNIDREAADASTSWGMFQIMGANYVVCGCSSVEEFVRAMCESEKKQLELAAEFIKRGGMLSALQNKNWAEFARQYNGAAYRENMYDRKLEKTYIKYRL